MSIERKIEKDTNNSNTNICNITALLAVNKHKKALKILDS
jgi:hypothetical protein